MARSAISQRPPIVASLSLFALAVMLGPRPSTVIVPQPLGPTPKCVVEGVQRGELYIPSHGWQPGLEMPRALPHGHWAMPILPPTDHDQMPVFDVDTLVSGLKQVLSTPRT